MLGGQQLTERDVRSRKRRRRRLVRKMKRNAVWVAPVVLVIGLLAYGAWLHDQRTAVALAPLPEAPLVSQSAGAAPVAAIVGDSYFAANGQTQSTPGAESVAAQVGDAMGWAYDDEYVVGGTGFIAKGYGGGDKTFAQLVPAVVAARPDVVLVEGGGNDTQYGPARTQAAAHDTLAQLRQGLPDAKIVMLGPLYSGSSDSRAMFDALRGAAASVPGVTYIDPDGWFPGVFYAATGPGRQYIGPDHVHPNVRGVDLLVRRTVSALRAADVPQG